LTPNIDEEKSYNIAVMALETGKEGIPDALDIGAKKFLSQGMYRSDGKKMVPVCAPTGTYARVLDAIVKKKLFQGRLTEYELVLASKLPNANGYIVEKIAESAFNETPQESEYFPNTDIRPLARSVLAGFDSAARPYAEIAYQQISDDNPLGTGQKKKPYPGKLEIDYTNYPTQFISQATKERVILPPSRI
jgi:hypothetical protein